MNSFRPLHDGWTLAPVPGTLPDNATPGGGAQLAGAGAGTDAGTELLDLAEPIAATVPGCVHTDLLAAGLIADPYLDDNELALTWIGRTDWSYRTTFDWTDDGADQVDLVCAGLDTVATVTLNDTVVGRTENMHRSYRFGVRSVLQPGRNELTVRFDSAYRYAEAIRATVGDRPNAYDEPFQYIRKMACNFGWDWGPTLVTAGIWQRIGLHSWSSARLERVLPAVSLVVHTPEEGDPDPRVGLYGHVDLRIAVRPAAVAGSAVAGGSAALGTGGRLRVAAEVAGVRVVADVPADEPEVTLQVVVPEPDLWWPRGYGDQHRYPLTVALSNDGDELDRWERQIGFRSARLETTPDAGGRPFTLLINEVPVFVRGVNWIPDDAFVTRVDRPRYAARVRQALDAGVNYLRVWGGGRYESEDFYDLADEHGLLVGQDFLFACAAYPEEEPLASEVVAEAREQVVRLAPHPSLVLWTGNNENIWGWFDWGWQAKLEDRSWGLGYYLETLPAIVADLDPTRPYWPGSPYSGSMDVHPNEPSHGTMHIWDVWNQLDYTRYRSYQPRFVAEFGFQGPPAYATLRRSVSDQPLAPDSPGVLHHQKADDGNGKLNRGLEGHLPTPRNFDDWHYATQLNQARAIQFGVEHLRSLRPLCWGAIVWQLNDCWPVTSWAAVDGDGRRKPLWYALRRAYADRLLTIQPRSVAGSPDTEGLALIAVNDARGTWTGPVDVTRYSFDGTPLARFSVELAVPAGGVQLTTLPAEITEPATRPAELLVAGSGPDRAYWWFVEDVEADHRSAGFDAQTVRVDGGYQVRVSARTLLRDLVIYPDRLDPAAEVDEAVVTLLPGEEFTFTVRSAAELDLTALTTPPVLRCVNQLTTVTEHDAALPGEPTQAVGSGQAVASGQAAGATPAGESVPPSDPAAA